MVPHGSILSKLKHYDIYVLRTPHGTSYIFRSNFILLHINHTIRGLQSRFLHKKAKIVTIPSEFFSKISHFAVDCQVYKIDWMFNSIPMQNFSGMYATWYISKLDTGKTKLNCRKNLKLLEVNMGNEV